jgi:hypothetical protein
VLGPQEMRYDSRSVFEEVEMDEDRAPLTPPRVSKKRKLKVLTIRNVGL